MSLLKKTIVKKNAPKTLPGTSFPLGATVYPDGVNFCIFSKNCDAVELLLFDAADHSQPQHVIQLNPEVNRTFYYWHAFIPGLKPGQLYGYRVHGPNNPALGYRFDGSKVLSDPYARAVFMDTYVRQQAVIPGDNCAAAIKSVVTATGEYDWKNDRPLDHPFSKSVIYEMHIGGFTKNPNSGLTDNLRGTFTGLVEKIPYLKKLGITAVELMPVQQFDPADSPSDLSNYWGYSPIALFAPHHGYGTSNDPLKTIREFKDMVRALHQAGIEVILDVVFNHTAEGDQRGPCLSLRGFENKAYYLLDEHNQASYMNFTGTGNTLNANHSIVRRMIRDCLRYWVSEMHVDGFRFDLAAVLARNQEGDVVADAPILWEIESDPVLAPTKIIAEAWDSATYQMGSFVGHKWAEWNDRFRDDVRRFIKGDRGMVNRFANRLTGSRDLFEGVDRDPNRSINIVCCHDGFTLNDLVSYNLKHNEDNREGNRDGAIENHSWNCGFEGNVDDPQIDELRLRQIKNFFSVLLFSFGTPMFLAGDEVRRSQRGNNNSYCQDNKTNWFDWDLVETEQELFNFVRLLIQLNLEIGYFNESRFWTCGGDEGGTTITWHGVERNAPDWSEDSHSLAFTLVNPNYAQSFHVMINAWWQALTFELPHLPEQNRSWHRLVDTAAAYGNDIFSCDRAPVVKNSLQLVQARSIVALIGK